MNSRRRFPFAAFVDQHPYHIRQEMSSRLVPSAYSFLRSIAPEDSAVIYDRNVDKGISVSRLSPFDRVKSFTFPIAATASFHTS